MNVFSPDEIIIFLRYKTFPIFLSALVLSSFFHVLWAYFRVKRRELLMISLAGFFLFFKEFLLFFFARNVLVNFNFDSVPFTFYHWMSLELIFNFFAIMCFIWAYSFFKVGGNINFPQLASSRAKFVRFFSINLVGVLAVVVGVGLLANTGNDLTIIMPFVMAFYFVIFRERMSWLNNNFSSFQLYFIRPLSRKLMSYYIFGSFLLFFCFTVFALLFSPLGGLFLGNEGKVIFDSSETYLHGLKALVNCFMALYLINLVRDEYVSFQEVVENKIKFRQEYAEFFSQIRAKLLKKTPPKELVELVLKEAQAITQSELILLTISAKERVVYDMLSSKVNWDSQIISLSSLPYVVDIEGKEDNYLINNLSALDKSVRQHFAFLPQEESKQVVFEEEYFDPEAEKAKEEAAQQSQSGSDFDEAFLNKEVAELSEKVEELENDPASQSDNMPEIHILPSEEIPEDENVAKEPGQADSQYEEQIQKEDEAQKEEEEEETEHVVENLMVIRSMAENVESHNDVQFNLFAINKKDNYYELWTRRDQYTKLQVLLEELAFYANYILNYVDLIGERRGGKGGFQLPSVIENLNAFFTNSEADEDTTLDYVGRAIFPDRFPRSFLKVHEKEDKVFVFMFYVVGNPRFVLLFYVLLQSQFSKLMDTKKGPGAILTELNKTVSHLKQDCFSNALVLSIDKKTGAMEMANAAHKPPMVFASGLPQATIEMVEGLPLGIQDKGKNVSKTQKLKKGDIVFLASENLVDYNDETTGRFTPKMVANYISAEKSAEEMTSEINAAADELALADHQLDTEGHQIFMLKWT